jgi:CheY-like chemotaxis protein
MTANAMDSDRQACLQAGMDDHLAKPFNALGLQAMLERHVVTGNMIGA